ncbi:MAG: hypothetical protein FWF98_04795 [Dehalococcoidia bacterium]|nr:hypothetical protein [Dehalococcoidia bacterium]
MLSEDPIRDGLNWYTYANNNPVMFIDTYGLASWWQWAIGAGQVVVGVALCATGVGGGLGASLIIGGGISLISYAVEPQIAQFIGGATSIMNGYGAVSTGISLWSYGLPGQIAGTALILIGGATMALGTNEMAGAITGKNYIQEWTGMSDTAYGLSYLGLNLASGASSFGGRMYMRHAGTSTISSGEHMSMKNNKPYARINRGSTTNYADGRGNISWSKHNASHGGSTNPHWHIGPGGGTHYESYWRMIMKLSFKI